MARTNKEIQKEIEQLREVDRITTIRINQEFSDLKQQEKKEISYNDFKNNCKFCNDRIYNYGYCDSHCKRYDKENQEKSSDQSFLEEKEKINKAIKEEKEEEKRQKLNDLFNCFAQAQLETIKETEQTKEFDERLKKFINKL